MTSQTVAQIVKYVLVGGVGTGVHYAALIALVSLAALDEVAASSVGALLGAFTNYFLNRWVTFESEVAHRRAMPRFFAVAAVGILINGAVMGSILDIGHVHYLWAQVCATLSVLVWGYGANRFWTFDSR